MSSPRLSIRATFLATTILLCAYCQSLVADAPVVAYINAGPGSECLVDGAPVKCDQVGPYLRDTLHIPVAGGIYLRFNSDANYAMVEAIIRSIRDAGYSKLGFVGDVVD